MQNSTTIDLSTTPSPTDGAPPITRQDLDRAITTYGDLCEDDGWRHARHGEAYRELWRLLDRCTLHLMRALPPHDPPPPMTSPTAAGAALLAVGAAGGALR